MQVAIKFFRSVRDFDAEAALFQSKIVQAANIFPHTLMMRPAALCVLPCQMLMLDLRNYHRLMSCHSVIFYLSLVHNTHANKES